jgi:adenylosuccinate lyase
MGRGISPLDGRYAETVAPLCEIFSEYALVRERCTVELLYLQAVDRLALFPPLSGPELAAIETALGSFGEPEFARVKAIESEIRHDVKACELFLRERLSLRHPDRIHFGLTSEDVNNLAYARLLVRYRDGVQRPQLRRLIQALTDRAEAWSAVPFPARTHGQPASPTTAGKEMAVFLSRLLRQADRLDAHRFAGKLSGATGTYGALHAAAPHVDWPAFSRQFVEDMGLSWSDCTTQIEGGDALAEHLEITARINVIVLDLALDVWQYISHGDFVQRTVSGEVGSSVMPHKVNPIQFENSEGNIIIANALLHTLGDKLTQSRMQRDLSGSTVARNIGVALAHSYLAMEQTLEGLERIDVDRDATVAQIRAHPEVLAEAIQTVLRLEGIDHPYEQLKSLTRGRTLTLGELHRWIDALEVDDSTKGLLNALKPDEYLGLAVAVCEETTRRARTWLRRSA